MLAFDGQHVPASIRRRLAEAPAAGLSLFRFLNVGSPGQVRELSDAFGRAAGAGPSGSDQPVLIAADQEGGQLIALGSDSTAFAGNMALGAVDDETLTERVGRAIGLEARAMGVNVVYAPVLDIASNPANPALGIRSFGDDPTAVARHGAAMVRGLRSAGVAATVKHAPGMGHVSADTHHGLAVVAADRRVLEAREFVPFRAAFAAGVGLAMSGHVVLPAITGSEDLPATLSRAVMTDLLRHDLGFAGVTISDALDMRAIDQGDGLAAAVVAAVRAGIDLLLTAADPAARARIEAALTGAAAGGAFEAAELAATDRRVAALRAWLGSAGPRPDLSIVGGAEHQALAREVAARSITLVRDPASVLPLRRSRILAVMPRPTDLTPADTSSTIAPALAQALRGRAATVDEVVVEPSPDPSSIDAIRARAAEADIVVLGTIDAARQPAQRALVDALAGVGRPLIGVALRGPWDVALYPERATVLATYSVLPSSLDALAAVLFGEAAASGRLPIGAAAVDRR
ncbi:MAG TPA: glycoside hydrolase family 3 N-terminal domain-containing protein [Candidatus Limnocylindrales bacterium]|nr:glycoside hydrolase family 3 N-terminal domain-containing protein [Candidatus Limnocylindrales bacterium]